MKSFSVTSDRIENKREFFSLGVAEGINVNGEMMTTILLSTSPSTEKKAEATEGREPSTQLVWLRIKWVERILAYSKENTDQCQTNVSSNPDSHIN